MKNSNFANVTSKKFSRDLCSPVGVFCRFNICFIICHFSSLETGAAAEMKLTKDVVNENLLNKLFVAVRGKFCVETR